MTINYSSPWHRESFDNLLRDRLPALLAQRLPLADYRLGDAGATGCLVSLTISAGGKEAAGSFTIPCPDADGVFLLDGIRRVVVPVASSPDLEAAEIACVGQQLYEFLESRLSEASADLPWDEALLRSLLPLEAWAQEFLLRYGQKLDALNCLSTLAHLRRVIVPVAGRLTTPSQFGRLCPYESPEGENIGRILSLAVGAAIRDGKLVIVDDRPEAGVSVTACMTPLAEHNDINRQLMGVNMMRQWLAPSDPEPALVQTGNELDATDFWCGRNLLTAFISLGGDTYEDAIVVSESAARRLSYRQALEVGDKLSNRHGTKGTIGRILPDDRMPRLSDGTPVELCFSFIGLHTRLNPGQLREAVWGRVARAEGKAVIIPPFHEPPEAELKARLRKAGLPEGGMESLTLAEQPMKRPSTVGWVYWGKTLHLAADKLHASVTPQGCNMQGTFEYYQLKEAGAYENIAENFHTRSVERPDADDFAMQVIRGEVGQTEAPSEKLSRLIKRLGLAGIRADFTGRQLRFSLSLPSPALKLACPVPHPWLAGVPLAEIGVAETMPPYAAVAEANARLERLLSGQAPHSLRQQAEARLRAAVETYLDALVDRDLLQMSNRVMFSGRAVLSPGADLRTNQLGLAEDIAWTLFGPLVERELGDAKSVQARTARAAQVLDEIMAKSWVILNRGPSVLPTNLLAFHPVRIQDRVIRIHPMACWLQNADFDGDQAGVFLPVTPAGQEEAGRLLTIAAHLDRNPQLIRSLCPRQGAMWGLASLSLSPNGLKRVWKILGRNVELPEGFLTSDALANALQGVLKALGVEQAMQIADTLWRLGMAEAAASGASIGPFAGQEEESAFDVAAPEEDWKKQIAMAAEQIASCRDFDNPQWGASLLAVKSGARGSLQHLGVLLGVPQTVQDAAGRSVRIARGWADGRSIEDVFATVASHREALGKTAIQCIEEGYGIRSAKGPRGFNVLSRAMRAERPGITFARAAAIGEIDPLTDLDARLFAGIPVAPACKGPAGRRP